MIQDHWALEAAGIMAGAIADVQGFMGEAKVIDDITLLVLTQR